MSRGANSKLIDGNSYENRPSSLLHVLSRHDRTQKIQWVSYSARGTSKINWSVT